MLARTLAGALGFGLTVNALIMFVDPTLWYHHLPGVSASGPLNLHFVRDIGCADLVAGGVFLARAFSPSLARSGLMTAAGFLCLHAGVHVWELVGARHDVGHHLARDLVPVYLPAALAAWLAAAAVRTTRTSTRV